MDDRIIAHAPQADSIAARDEDKGGDYNAKSWQCVDDEETIQQLMGLDIPCAYQSVNLERFMNSDSMIEVLVTPRSTTCKETIV